MTHGLPDWYSGIDIAYQSLSEAIMRPKYGLRGMIDFANYVSDSDETELAFLKGKGILYGGGIMVQSAATQKNDYVGSQFELGVKYHAPTFLQYSQFTSGMTMGPAWHLQCFDEVNFRYTVALTMGLTFEESCKIFYVETHGRTPYVVVKILYALL